MRTRHPASRTVPSVEAVAARRALALPLAALLTLSASGCDHGHDHPHAAAATSPATAPAEGAAGGGGRLDIPAPVRQNLGITFARAEYRRVASTLRLPGRFELPPDARQEVRAPFGGTVGLRVRQYDRVEPGQVVALVRSPEWHRLQLEIEEDEAGVAKARAELAVAEQTLNEGQERARLLAGRVAALDGAGVRRTELESEAAAARSALPRLRAEVDAKRAALDAAVHHLPLAKSALAAQLGVTVEHLVEPVDAPGGPRPRWAAMALVEVRAAHGGVVESVEVSDGGRADARGLLMTLVDPGRVRFRAVALQSDLDRLRDGLAVSVAAGGVGRAGADTPIPGTMRLAPVADPDQRTVDVLVSLPKPEPWARPGVTGFAEVVTGGGEEELAIPRAAVVQDGLVMVYYRRDRRNPDVAVRTEADLGASDGRWVAVLSGLAEGDEVVVDGVYELKLAGAAKGGAPTGGHFHADGTWHADGTPEPGTKGGGRK